MKYIISGLLLICCSLSSCTGNKTSSDAKNQKPIEDSLHGMKVNLTTAQLNNANLQIGTVIDTTVHKIVKVNGHMDVPPSNIVSISIPLGGYIKKTNLIPGLYVKKGAVLATLEDPSYIQLQQDYLTAISKLVYLEADYNRQKTLNETKVASDKIFQSAKSDFESQKYFHILNLCFEYTKKNLTTEALAKYVLSYV
jgi:cobalt-zinc-cadmium efflux system membrane fusion protein